MLILALAFCLGFVGGIVCERAWLLWLIRAQRPVISLPEPTPQPSQRKITSRGLTFSTIVTTLKEHGEMTPDELAPYCQVVRGTVYGCLNLNRDVFEGQGYSKWRLKDAKE